MATNLAANQMLELKTFCSLVSQQGISVLHYFVSGVAGGNMTDQQCATSLEATLAPLYKAYLPNIASWLGVRLQIIQPVPAAAAVIATANTGFGSVASDPLPAQSSMLATKRTVFAGRRFRGRMYLPFWCESQSDASGFPTAAAKVLAGNVTAVALNTISVVVGGVTATLTPVLWHPDTLTSTFISSNVIRSAWATQRRRSQINKADAFGP